jgi:hypothetical protein
MQEPGAGVTREAERIEIVLPSKPSSRPASAAHIDYGQLWLYIYQGLAPQSQALSEADAGIPIFAPRHEVNNLTPRNIFRSIQVSG